MKKMLLSIIIPVLLLAILFFIFPDSHYLDYYLHYINTASDPIFDWFVIMMGGISVNDISMMLIATLLIIYSFALFEKDEDRNTNVKLKHVVYGILGTAIIMRIIYLCLFAINNSTCDEYKTIRTQITEISDNKITVVIDSIPLSKSIKSEDAKKAVTGDKIDIATGKGSLGYYCLGEVYKIIYSAPETTENIGDKTKEAGCDTKYINETKPAEKAKPIVEAKTADEAKPAPKRYSKEERELNEIGETVDEKEKATDFDFGPLFILLVISIFISVAISYPICKKLNVSFFGYELDKQLYRGSKIDAGGCIYFCVWGAVLFIAILVFLPTQENINESSSTRTNNVRVQEQGKSKPRIAQRNYVRSQEKGKSKPGIAQRNYESHKNYDSIRIHLIKDIEEITKSHRISSSLIVSFVIEGDSRKRIKDINIYKYPNAKIRRRITDIVDQSEDLRTLDNGIYLLDTHVYGGYIDGFKIKHIKTKEDYELLITYHLEEKFPELGKLRGSAFIDVTVSEDGNNEVKVSQSLHPEIDKMALELAKKLPWHLSEITGKRKGTNYRLTIMYANGKLWQVKMWNMDF